MPSGGGPNAWRERRLPARRVGFDAPLRHFASGGERAVAEAQDEVTQGGEDTLIALAEQGREDVLADLVAPEVVAAVTPRGRHLRARRN